MNSLVSSSSAGASFLVFFSVAGVSVSVFLFLPRPEVTGVLVSSLAASSSAPDSGLVTCFLELLGVATVADFLRLAAGESLLLFSLVTLPTLPRLSDLPICRVSGGLDRLLPPSDTFQLFPHRPVSFTPDTMMLYS